MAVSTVGGPGRRKCGGDGCPVYVPVATKVCPKCGWMFPRRFSAGGPVKPGPTKSGPTRPGPKSDDDRVTGGEDDADGADPSGRIDPDKRDGILITPNGSPPPLESTSRGAIHRWVRAIEDRFPRSQISMQAALYWLARIHAPGSEEYLDVKAELEQIETLCEVPTKPPPTHRAKV